MYGPTGDRFTAELMVNSHEASEGEEPGRCRSVGQLGGAVQAVSIQTLESPRPGLVSNLRSFGFVEILAKGSPSKKKTLTLMDTPKML